MYFQGWLVRASTCITMFHFQVQASSVLDEVLIFLACCCALSLVIYTDTSPQKRFSCHSAPRVFISTIYVLHFKVSF